MKSLSKHSLSMNMTYICRVHYVGGKESPVPGLLVLSVHSCLLGGMVGLGRMEEGLEA